MRKMAFVAALLGVACAVGAAEIDDELRAFASRVEGFEAVELPAAPARVVLKPEQSLAADRLRGVALDDQPPVLGQPPQPYDPKMTDNFPPGKAPYVAPGIQPFRFRFFHNEFNYGGWHNFAMQDYALTHGFGILSPYVREPADCSHLPKGTQFLKWGGFVNWDKWLPAHDIPAGRYDKLADLDVTTMLVKEGVFKPNPGFDYLMIDMEHPLLSPEALRKQPWFPIEGGDAFEKRYYDGYAKTYTAPVGAARQAGWRNISLYGWQPFARTFWGLEDVKLDSAPSRSDKRPRLSAGPASGTLAATFTYWRWLRFGKRIYEAVDILNPSVYCFYWTPKNVAYTLANLDLNMKLIASMPDRKPVRPYYWTLLHGGGGGWRWWAGQPVRSEDVRAMTAMAFFTGIDGIDLWNWSGTGNHHVPALKPDADLTVARPFTSLVEKTTTPINFRRYDAIHINSVSEEGIVRFQRINKDGSAGHYGIDPARPSYWMPRKELAPCLRPQSEPVAAMIEGLALVKPFERLLRQGELEIDVSAQDQFGQDLPIVRRARLGPWQVIATYDPMWAAEQAPRQITLDDFDGRKGLTLVVPADGETRLFLLKLP